MGSSSSWKAVLGEYIEGINRMEVELKPDNLSHIVTDSGFLKRHFELLRRIHERDNDRPALIRAEIRAKPVLVKEGPMTSSVRLDVLRRWQLADNIRQERYETQNVTLVNRRGQWTIAKVEVEIPEKKAAAAEARAASSDKVPLPFINRDVLEHRSNWARQIRYNREAARHYANLWWNAANPRYQHFDVDCTNFISQCLIAGGLPMNYTGRRDSGWWYEGYSGGRERWSFSWAVAHSFQTYLLSSKSGTRGTEVGDPRELVIGDVISYDWEGDGRYTHTTIVTGFDGAGYPLVNAHTNNSINRYWDYRDSYAWTERTRYTFIHIPDVL